MNFNCFNDRATLEAIAKRNEPYQSPESIVIAVGAITTNLDTSFIALALKNQLTKIGYRATLIASDPTLRVLGNPFLPLDLMISPQLERTIVCINQFINYVQLLYHSDNLRRIAKSPFVNLFFIVEEILD